MASSLALRTVPAFVGVESNRVEIVADTAYPDSNDSGVASEGRAELEVVEGGRRYLMVPRVLLSLSSCLSATSIARGHHPLEGLTCCNHRIHTLEKVD
jgi:hypothetical protein